jgi:hypothetical protein
VLAEHTYARAGAEVDQLLRHAFDLKRERSLAPLKLVVLGLSLSSSWGNGHATTYRALLKAFAERGHDILFLERDVPWYAAHRDLTIRTSAGWPSTTISPTSSAGARRSRADAVIVGSYVPDGVAVGEWVLANRGA